MTHKPTHIRIAIKEPSPGWWAAIKDLAVRQGCFVSHLVVDALEEYVDRHSPPPPRRRVPYTLDGLIGDRPHEAP